MFVIRYRKIFFAISALVVTSAIAAMVIFGLNFGIDFTGGEIAEVSYDTRPDKALVMVQLDNLGLGAYSLRAAGEDQFILRVRPLNEDERAAVFTTITTVGEHTGSIDRFNSVGPTIGTELRNKAGIAIIAVVLAIILFISIAFRGVSKPVSSWKYGVIAVIALLHDVIIPTGVMAIMGYLFGAEIDVLFVMAILAILGYSVNDTIVVFDRVRENLRENNERNRTEDFELTVGKSLQQTYARSINTSFTTLLALLALFFIGAAATQNFALVLIAGIVAGTFSSVFLAAPLLVAVHKWGK